MAKYAQFVSPLEQLTGFKFIRTLRNWYFEHNKFDHDPNRFLSERGDSQLLTSLKPLILGGINPLRYTFKDFKDTFKPYKAGYHIFRDLLQPIFGFANMLKGVFDLVASPIILIAKLVGHAIDKAKGKFQKDSLKTDLAMFLGGLLSGVSSFVRGWLQLKTTLLNWFIRFPLRGIITLVKGMPSLGDSVKDRVDELDTIIGNSNASDKDKTKLNNGLKALFKKGLKAVDRGQKTNIHNIDDYRRCYLDVAVTYPTDMGAKKTFLAFFKTNEKGSVQPGLWQDNPYRQ